VVSSGPGENKSRRRGVPFVSAYDAKLEFLFINHLHDETSARGEGITSFFIRKYIYLALFGRLSGVPAMQNGSGQAGDLGGVSSASSISSTQQQGQPDDFRINWTPRAPDPEEEAELFVSDTDERQSQTDREGSVEREQQEREQQEREQQERERQEREQQEREQQEREQQEREQQEREHRKIAINFARWEDNV
jgi:outer membrane biosynthesis protein TonB